jgi:hypothetical protein
MTERKPPPADGLPDHLARWLEAVSRRLYSELGASGLLAFPELRGSHRRILQTARGEAAAADAQRAMDAVERTFRQEAGADAYDAMKQVLRQLGRDSFAG